MDHADDDDDTDHIRHADDAENVLDSRKEECIEVHRAANGLELLLLQLFRRTGADKPTMTMVTTMTTMSGGVRSQKCDNQQVTTKAREERSCANTLRRQMPTWH